MFFTVALIVVLETKIGDIPAMGVFLNPSTGFWQNAESKNDFIHKFKIAAKEVEETKYWLVLCKHSSNYPSCDHLILLVGVIDKIITKIIATSKVK